MNAPGAEPAADLFGACVALEPAARDGQVRVFLALRSQCEGRPGLAGLAHYANAMLGVLCEARTEVKHRADQLDVDFLDVIGAGYGIHVGPAEIMPDETEVST